MSCTVCGKNRKFKCGVTKECKVVYCSQKCGDEDLKSHICSQFLEIGATWDELSDDAIMHILVKVPFSQIRALRVADSWINTLLKNYQWQMGYLRYRGQPEVQATLLTVINDGMYLFVRQWFSAARQSNTFIPTANNNEAIRLASANGHVEIVRLLLEDECEDPDQDSEYKNKSFSEIFPNISEAADPTDRSNEAIRRAAGNGHANVVRLLLEYQREDFVINPAANTSEAIRFASEDGYVDVVRILLEDGRVNPAASNNYPIQIASTNGHAEIVRLLLRYPRVDPTATDNAAIGYASGSGHVDVVRILLEDGRADPTANDNYAIRQSSINGRTEVVRLLLEDGRANPAARNNIALQFASKSGYVEIVRLLLEDPRVSPVALPNDPIVFASKNGHTEVVRLLLTDGRADPATSDNYAIRQASANGHTEIVRLLLKDGRASL